MAHTPSQWDVEDNAFWDATGKSIANRNLWVSIPNLLCGFSVWMYWGMIAATMQRLHIANPELFNFTFNNNGQPYDEAGIPGTAVHASGGSWACGRDAADSQFVHDCDLRRAQRQIHDDRAADHSCAADGNRPAESANAVFTSTSFWRHSPASAAGRLPRACRTSRSSSRSGCRGSRWGSTPGLEMPA